MSELVGVPDDFVGSAGSQLLLSPSALLVGVVAPVPLSYRCSLSVYDANDGRPVGGPLDLGDFGRATFIDDETLLLTGEKQLLRWRVADEVPEVALPVPGLVRNLAVDPDCRRVAYVFNCTEGERRSWRMVALADLDTGEQLWEGLAPFSCLHLGDLTFTPGGRFVVVDLDEGGGSEAYALMLFEAATGRRTQTFYTQHGIWGTAVAPDDETFVVFADHELAVYELASADPVRTLPPPREWKYPFAQWRFPVAMCFARDGSWLRVFGDTGTWVRLEPVKGKVLQRGKLPAALGNLVVSANGRAVAGVTEDNTLAVFPLGDPSKPKRRTKK